MHKYIILLFRIWKYRNKDANSSLLLQIPLLLDHQCLMDKVRYSSSGNELYMYVTGMRIIESVTVETVYETLPFI